MENFASDPSLAQLMEGMQRQFAQSFVTQLFDLGLATGRSSSTPAS